MQGWSESMSWESPWAEHSAPEIGDVNQQGFHFPEKHCDLFMYIYILFISFFLYIPTQYWPNVGLSQHDSQYVSICRISSIYLHILHTTHIYIYNILCIYILSNTHMGYPKIFQTQALCTATEPQGQVDTMDGVVSDIGINGGCLRSLGP